jgi:hypothetical protein
MKNNKLTLSETIEQAIEAIREKAYTDESYKSAILDKLHTMQNFEVNLWALSIAMGSIRSIAQKNKIPVNEDVLTLEDPAQHLKEIEQIADRLHNVPGYLLDGTPCDGLYLYLNGVDENWPTGLVARMGFISSVYFPNSSSSYGEYEDFSLPLMSQNQ